MTAPKRGITVLVCGGRNYADTAAVRLVLDTLHSARDIWHVVTGGSEGADRLGEGWAYRNGVRHSRYPANWDLHGRAAGPIRNRVMLRMERPDLVVAFPGGAGTADMVRQARAAGVEVYEAGVTAPPLPRRGAAR